MVTYLQQSLSDEYTFAVTDDPAKATHFCENDGAARPIDELNIEEPLGLPTMNFGEREKDKKTVKGKGKAATANAEELLGQPVMQF